jgi:hypothetical protein
LKDRKFPNKKYQLLIQRVELMLASNEAKLPSTSSVSTVSSPPAAKGAKRVISPPLTPSPKWTLLSSPVTPTPGSGSSGKSTKKATCKYYIGFLIHTQNIVQQVVN